jgi:O-antigen ligase
MGTSRTQHGSRGTAANAAGWLLIALLVLSFTLGGGARGDINSVAILRPLAMFAGFIGLALLTRVNARGMWPLFAVAAMALAWIGAQMIPLPPSIIAALPGQEPYVAASAAMAVADAWRPLSVVPSQTSNAFYAAIVPVAALILFAGTHGHFRRMAMAGVVLFGIISALIGLMQLGVGDDSPLFFYAITNEGSPVGLFANRNHQGMLMACMPPLLAYLVVTRPKMSSLPWLAVGVWILMAIFVLALGSRGGLILFVASSAAVFVMLPAEVRQALPGPRALRGKMHYVYPVIVAGGFAAFVTLASRTLAWQRLMESDQQYDLRGDIVAPVSQMMSDFFPVGAGGGTFPYVFYRYEPTEMLSQAYVNHVHNDYLEVVFEYGLPGVAIAVFAIALLATAAWGAWRDGTDGEAMMASRAATVGLAVLFVGSIVDYPLRVPSLACVAVLFAASLFRRRVVD